MNTPKKFEPVVTDGMIDVGAAKRSELWATSGDVLLAMTNHPDFQRHLRAYAAEVARAMLHDEIDEDEGEQYARGFNDYRERTLSAIDEWEKSHD